MLDANYSIIIDKSYEENPILIHFFNNLPFPEQ